MELPPTNVYKAHVAVSHEHRLLDDTNSLESILRANISKSLNAHLLEWSAQFIVQ